ncbi:hypothetical protein B0H21DRAFT_436235 [Amylocystis lapponica]|nr:hypothetical protein B0H21DRAFT_436235 [Amylocystis lapponica]
MLIHLIPRQSHPTIFYSVSLPDPCERVQMPAGWSAQLQRLHADEIDIPNTVFALDAATWLTAVIHDVTFDLPGGTVSCSFIDGQGVQWPLVGECIDALEQVVADVIQATAEKERESAPPAPLVQPEPSVPEQKPTKHKKQRSLLMSLVSSFNKLSLNISMDSPVRSLATPPPSPRPPPPPPTFLPPSNKVPFTRRAAPRLWSRLQSRARATLVDTFRSFVLSELRARIAPGRYATWAAHGMLRRAEGHMAFLVEEAGGVLPDLRDTTPPFPVRKRVPSAPFFDDEDEHGSLTDSSSTDTDVSSVHTPVDSPAGSPFNSVSSATAQTRGAVPQLPRSPSPRGFSPEDLATYTTLSAQSTRLRALLARMADTREDVAHDERGFLAVLEVKSRRRAWSNGTYLGGARLAALGLATPFRSSPLARMPTRRVPSLDVCTGEHDVATLFPVCEDDGEEEGASIQDATLCDLESGLLVAFQRPNVRSRTKSMHALQGRDLDLPLASEGPPQSLPPPKPVALSVSPGLPSNALLCQPLKSPPAMLEPQTKFPLFDHPELAGEDEDDITSEFTLSMDLPPPYSKVYHHDSEQWSPGGDTYPCR